MPLYLPDRVYCRWCRQYNRHRDLISMAIHPVGYRCTKKPHVSLLRNDNSVLEIDPDQHQIAIATIYQNPWSAEDLVRYLNGEKEIVEGKSYYRIFVEQVGIASGDVLRFEHSRETMICYHIDHVDPETLIGICYRVDLMGKVDT